MICVASSQKIRRTEKRNSEKFIYIHISLIEKQYSIEDNIEKIYIYL